jgi:hypothetical protein
MRLPWVTLSFAEGCGLSVTRRQSIAAGDSLSRFVVVGKRNQDNANVLLERLHVIRCGYIPFFTSDQLPHYVCALLHVYGMPEVILHIPAKRRRTRC